MNRVYAIAIALVLPLLMSFAPADWMQWESAAGKYKIQFPSGPVSSEQDVPSDIGTLKMNITMLDLSSKPGTDENMIYMVLFTDYPADKVSHENKELLPNFFRKAIDGGVANMKGTLLSEKEITLGKYPGREFKVSFAEGQAVVVGRVFLVKNRMFLIQTGAVAGKEDNASAQKFFNSFALVQ